MRATAWLLALLTAANLSAGPSAEEILSKARKAIGKVDTLKSLSLAGTRKIAVVSETVQTQSREVEIDMLLPDKFLKAETMELPNGLEGPTILEGLDGDKSWRDTRNVPTGGNVVIRMGPPPGGGPQDGPAADAMRTRAIRNNYLRHLLMLTLTPPAGLDLKFDAIGEAESGADTKAWILDVSGPDNFALRLFIDQKTSLPIMASWRALQAPKPVIRTMQGPPGHTAPAGAGDHPPLPEAAKPKEVEHEMRLSDYAKFGGLLLPKLMSLSSEGKLAEEFELKNAKINPNIKPDKFRK